MWVATAVDAESLHFPGRDQIEQVRSQLIVQTPDLLHCGQLNAEPFGPADVWHELKDGTRSGLVLIEDLENG